MKNLLIVLAFFTLIFANSCDNSNEIVLAESLLDSAINRGAEAHFIKVQTFSLDGVVVDLKNVDVIDMVQLSEGDADAQAINMIHQSLMGAEKETQLLDVNFSMSEEPVENGLFMFSIQSPDEKLLTIQMLDEEGFQMAANNIFTVHEGENYKALNVTSIDNGEYLFRLKDKEGRELVRSVTINNQ